MEDCIESSEDNIDIPKAMAGTNGRSAIKLIIIVIINSPPILLKGFLNALTNTDFLFFKLSITIRGNPPDCIIETMKDTIPAATIIEINCRENTLANEKTLERA